MSTSDGRVVRAFHRFTLVDQSSRGRESRDLTKGRRRDQGAVKISCARQVGLGALVQGPGLRGAAFQVLRLSAVFARCSSAGLP